MGIGFDLLNRTIYVAGTTSSRDFPRTRQPYGGGDTDGFIASFQSSSFGAMFSGALYIGGSGTDRIHAFAFDNFYWAVAGATTSPDLPVVRGETSLAGGVDAFYGSGVVYSGTFNLHYLGGSGDDRANAIAIHTRSSRVWIGGETRSPDFDGGSVPGYKGESDAFLTSAPLSINERDRRSVLLGGSGADAIQALVVEPTALIQTTSTIAFAGTTTSADLALVKATQSQHGGATDAFAGALSMTTFEPVWLTYIGGSAADEATSITRNTGGDVYVGGWSRSTDLPVTAPLQERSAGGEDGMLAVFSDTGALLHSTYFGGSGDDRIRGVRINPDLAVRVVGSTASRDLPSLKPKQERGGLSDGFIADIGTDQLIGPGELILPKDGAIAITLRAGRSAPGDLVTWRSSDPSRARVMQSPRSGPLGTSNLGTTVTVEALADSGEVDIIATYPGLLEKRIKVRLYPGAFTVPATGPALTTWSGPAFSWPVYTAFDPATERPIGNPVQLRSGAPDPRIQWVVSEPGILQVRYVGTALIVGPGRPGEARLTFSVDGYRTLVNEQSWTVTRPALQPIAPIRLGQDLATSLTAQLTPIGSSLSTGTITARSSDPSRLLISSQSGQLGDASATVELTPSSRGRATFGLNALAAEGEVSVILTSSEFEGEVTVPVTLEPAVLRWGFDHSTAAGTVVDSQESFQVGAPPRFVLLAFESASGSPATGRRPGAPPIALSLSNSNPRIVEINRVTVTDPARENYTVTGLAPGSSELTLALSGSGLRLANTSVRVEITPLLNPIVVLPQAQVLGRGLQQLVEFRVNGRDIAPEVISENPSALLVSTAPTVRGSASVTAAAQGTGSDRYRFYIQGLESRGEARVRVRIPGEEATMVVTLLPSGVGIQADTTATNRIRVSLWALDPTSSVGLQEQLLAPGIKIPVRLRTEGSPIALSRDAVELEAGVETIVEFTRPAAGSESFIIAETSAEFTGPESIARMRTEVPEAGTFIFSGFPGNTVTIAKDELREGLLAAGFAGEFSLTSSDPERLLLSTSPEAVPSPSIHLASPSRNSTVRFFLHGLTSSGASILRFESPDSRPAQVLVSLTQLNVLSFSASTSLGASVTQQPYLNARTLRPGATPGVVRFRIANPSIATLTPEVVEWSLGAPAPSLPITGVTPGKTALIIEAPEGVGIPYEAPIFVADTEQSQSLRSLVLGKDLQVSLQFELPRNLVGSAGAVVTLSSSDPSKLLLSRAESTPGTGSISVAVPAGQSLTQPVHLQALADSGEVTIEAVVGGTQRVVGRVTLAPSFLSCSVPDRPLPVGELSTMACSLMFHRSTNPGVRLRAGLDSLQVRVTSSAPEVLTVGTVVPTPTGFYVPVTAVSRGQAQLRIEPLSDPQISIGGPVWVSVGLPQIYSECRELVLVKDSQVTCRVRATNGAEVSAISQDPALLLISTDPLRVGTATVSGPGELPITIQALQAFGTGEVVLRAPGHSDLILPIVLRRPLLQLGSPNPLVVPRNGSMSISVGLMTPQFTSLPARPGATLAAELTATPSGVVAIDPGRISFPAGQGAVQVMIRGLAPGSAVLRLSGPEDVEVPSAAIAVTVP